MNVFYRKSAFTLIELLVVIAIIALLVSIILPSLGTARILAKITQSHMELRGITVALDIYFSEYDELPLTKVSCSYQSGYEMPIELKDYLPVPPTVGPDVIEFRDPFGEDTYKYRAVTRTINNGSLTNEITNIWIPDDFPNDTVDTAETAGDYYPKKSDSTHYSPVKYAVWSLGPDVGDNGDLPDVDIEGHIPVPKRYWLTGANDTGVVTHFLGSNGQMYMSP